MFYRFLVKDIEMKRNMITLDVNSSPKDITVRKEFENLPLKYVKMKIDIE